MILTKYRDIDVQRKNIHIYIAINANDSTLLSTFDSLVLFWYMHSYFSAWNYYLMSSTAYHLQSIMQAKSLDIGIELINRFDPCCD